MSHDRNDHFVHDGYWRARAANVDKITAEVGREYADRLQSTGLFQRLLIYREMRREIERRLDRVAPPWGLYYSANS